MTDNTREWSKSYNHQIILYNAIQEDKLIIHLNEVLNRFLMTRIPVLVVKGQEIISYKYTDEEEKRMTNIREMIINRTDQITNKMNRWN